eukprot:6938997-Prorocentrum_lima.AAC.1
MQRALENHMLQEQNLQAKALVEAISAHVRDQQRDQESHLRALNEELHREQGRSRTAVDIMEEGHTSLKPRMEEMLVQTGITNTKEPFEPWKTLLNFIMISW